MPILTINETKLSGRSSWTIEGGRTYTLQVRVITDDKRIGPRTAMLACNIGVGSPFRYPLDDPGEFDYGSTLVGISAEKEGEDGLSYIVTMEFGPYKPLEQSGAENDNTFTMNPLLVPPTVRWSSETVEIACTHTRDGKLIANVNKDPFDPPLTRPQTIPLATVSRVLASFDPNWIAAYQGCVNAFDWLGYPAGTVMLKEISADKTFNADWGWLWSQTLVFAFRPIRYADDGTTLIEAGWSEMVLNAGLREKKAGVVKQIIIDGSPISSPVALTSKGEYDPSGDQGYLVFDVLPTLDFSVLGLPEDLFSQSGGA
jgi:hypothetical protein